MPPASNAPLQAASMTPDSPPQTRLAPTRANSLPTASASRSTSEGAFDPPMTAICRVDELGRRLAVFSMGMARRKRRPILTGGAGNAGRLPCKCSPAG